MEGLGLLKIDSGIRLKGTDIWLDPHQKKPLAFVSHAHADHALKNHQVAIVSSKTARFYAKGFKGKEIIALSFGRRERFGGATITLFPAGHILGSSQIMIEKPGLKVVYTGDIKLRKGLTSERIEIKRCDVLIIECTYGDPRFVFPDFMEAAQDLLSFIKACFSRKITPVVIAYRIGKAQEIIKLLGDRGIVTRLESSIYEATEIYRDLGINLINYKRYPPFVPGKEVIIVPPYRRDLVKYVTKRTIAPTGWAMDKKMVERLCVDRAVPISDHADFSELLAYVMLSRPKRVYTVHGDSTFSDFLRRQGIYAKHIEVPYQLTLNGYF